LTIILHTTKFILLVFYVSLSVYLLSQLHAIYPHEFSENNTFQTKRRETLISYLVYIKEQTEKDASLVNMDELANVAIVMTNQGEKIPKRDNVHFTPIYGNRFNLPQTFPGMVVSSSGLRNHVDWFWLVFGVKCHF